MKLKDFGFRIWNGKKYLKQKIYNDNINNNEYIAVTGNVDDENYVFTIEHGCERDYYGGDYDEYCKVKDFTTCNYEIELFTGFYDKNGKKIFEGDILENKEFEEFYLITRNDIVYNILEIEIYRKNIKGQLYKYKKNADISFFKSIPSSKYMEIVGNINVNKDLLEETNESKS
ncbi:TPA: hypothetical protein R8I52_000286 [Campylobacter jejuni]|nr:hypothetical protein [Campylobacter jejuni]HED9960861.1 hypothetical protein [Campylobacter jejuni]HED9975297.1 hypothetical protein [Campylobacter jejuni]HEF3724358.1 hypothetical protein [Campylobacter jejuni]HEF3742405.1 hypothetical protein [Campylobacter jejuni]